MERNPLVFGSFVLGRNDIYERLKKYKESIGEIGNTDIFICKVDIKGCYDSIDQQLLMELAKSLVNEIEYVVYKYSTIYMSNGNPTIRYHRKARPSRIIN